MNIDYITTMTRVGEIVIKDPNEYKLALIQDPYITDDQLKDNRGRVYALVVDNKIIKLGGSQQKGGIRATIGCYLNGFKPKNSQRTYCVWHYLHKALKNNKKVEFYCVWAAKVTAEVATMTGSVIKEATVDFHEMEYNFVQEYLQVEGQHPELNVQESGKTWAKNFPELVEGWT